MSEYENEQAAPAPAVATPIDATKSDTHVAVLGFLRNLVMIAGILIGFLGLAEESMVVRLYRFALTQNGLVLLAFIAGIATWAYDLVRKIMKNRQVQVLSLLPSTPDSVAVGPTNPSASVERAVAVATQSLDQAGERR